jgi:hypothetical protein
MDAITHKLASPLSRKATLVAVVARVWTARKLDRKVTDKVNREHHASADAGRFNKLLVNAKHLEKITAIVGKARKLHYAMTKAWADDGLRILPNVLHQKFGNEFRLLKREFEPAVDEFCRDYPRFVEERERALGDMFNAADYPSPEEIRSKFELDVKTFPVPEADDFRSDVLDADTIADIKRELEVTSENVLQGAMSDTVKQMVDVVSHMNEKLKTYGTSADGKKNFFTDSLVGNVRELAELLPAFNFTNDPALTAVANRIKAELCVEEAETLRKSETVRESVQKSADDILRDIEGLIG